MQFLIKACTLKIDALLFLKLILLKMCGFHVLYAFTVNKIYSNKVK